MTLFLLIPLGLLLLNALWWWQTDSVLRRQGGSWRLRLWPLLLAGGMAFLLAVFFLSPSTGFPARDHLPLPVVAALYLWHLVVLPVWLVFSPAVGLVSFLSARAGRASGPAESESGGSGWNRRNFLVYAMTAAPAALLLGTTSVSIPQLRQFRIRRFELALPRLPPALEGLTLAHVSDVHVGPFTSGDVLKRIIRATNQLNADLVLLPGDLINHNLDDLPEAIALVHALKARHGVFLCAGNHDLMPGPEEFERRTKAAGVNLLMNEERTLSIRGEQVQILGLRWGTRRFNHAYDTSDEAISEALKELLGQRDMAAFPILLAHHPHALDPAAEAGLPLVLSGHTHGGQLMINEDLGFGPALFRYWSGIYQKSGSTLAVSNGVGNWFPLRTAAPAEILHLTLRRKPPG